MFGRSRERELLHRALGVMESIQKDISEMKTENSDNSKLLHAHFEDKELHQCQTRGEEINSLFDRTRDTETQTQKNCHEIVFLRRTLWGILTAFTPFAIWALNAFFKG